MVRGAEIGAALPVEAVIAAATRRSLLQCDGGFLYWLEQRPQQRGRGVIVRWSASTGTQELTPESLSVRARVHEYGGGEFAVHQGRIVFCAEPGQSLWLRDEAGLRALSLPEPAAGGAVRFADFCWHPTADCFYAVRETHHPESGHVDNDVVAITLDGVCTSVASGADFYAAPRVSPCGRQLIWLQWSNPLMPWDGTEWCVARLATPTALREPRTLAGAAEESVLQPGFLRDGRMLAVSDRGQWWQLGEWVAGQQSDNAVWQALTPIGAEAAVAPWSLGTRTWCEIADAGICAILAQNGRQQLCYRAHGQTAWQILSLPVSCLAPTLAADAEHVYLLGAAPDCDEQLLQYRLRDGAIRVIAAAPDWPEAVPVVPAEQRQVLRDGDAIPFNFYRPSDALAPPLLVLCHSGPTGSASPALQAAIQFWTSRGFAIADVNYRGSDGFGRRWRQSLLGHWGEFDVADCVEVIADLIAEASVDRERIFLRGNSAGGLTVLQLLARHHGIRAAAVRYPVVDLPALAAVSHKFEAHYLQRLVGASEVTDEVMVAASPNQQFARIRTPLLIQQGDQDTVVPVAQAEQLAAALQANRVAHELVLYQGEGHGFRRSDTLATALENEWRFFRQFC